MMEAKDLAGVIDLTSSWRAEGLSFTQIARRLNERGLRNAEGGMWTKEAISMRFSRTIDPGAALQRVDSAAGRLRLSLHLLSMIADSGGPKAALAQLGLDAYHDAIRVGMKPHDAADVARDIVKIAREDRRREEAK